MRHDEILPQQHTARKKTKEQSLLKDQIDRLDEIGFNWKVRRTFEQRCHDLDVFTGVSFHTESPVCPPISVRARAVHLYHISITFDLKA